MKISQTNLVCLVALVLSILTKTAAGDGKCGDPWREPCLSDSDKRYKSGLNYDIIEQNKVKALFTGYYMCDMFAYGPDGQPMEVRRGVLPGFGPIAVQSFPYKVFNNYTVDGTRAFNHRYRVSKAAPGSTNPGMAQAVDIYGTSTFELDGTVVTLPFAQNIARPDGTVDNLEPTTTYSIGNNTVVTQGLGTFSAGTNVIAVITCTDATCDNAREMVSFYSNSELVFFQACHQKRVTEQEFIDQIKASYEASAVPVPARPVVPMTGPSASGMFPTEEQWCQYDPNCATNPYDEPTTSVKAGVIAGFTIGGVLLFLIVVAAAVIIYNKQQAKRYRAVFAARVAQTMSISLPAKRMDAAALAREFQKIDAQSTAADKGNRRASAVGNITKEGMWEFLSSGKVVEMNRNDFEALWAVMDADGNGYVDFLEFCAFMGQCHDEYDAASNDRALMAERLSRQFSHRFSQTDLRAAAAAGVAVKDGDEGSEGDGISNKGMEDPEGKEEDEEDSPRV